LRRLHARRRLGDHIHLIVNEKQSIHGLPWLPFLLCSSTGHLGSRCSRSGRTSTSIHLSFATELFPGFVLFLLALGYLYEALEFLVTVWELSLFAPL